MKLVDLFNQQRILDAEIERKHPRQSGEDRIAKKLLALSVELGECANEWRGFKFWSTNQNAKTLLYTTVGASEENASYFNCGNCGERVDKEDSRLKTLFGMNYEECPECQEGNLYAFRQKNPLLEEYIDCLHFALSIGNEYTDRHGEGEETSSFLNVFDYLDDEDDEYQTESIVCQFNGIYNYIGLLSSKTDGSYSVEYALEACSNMINNIIGLGEMLGFTWQDIMKAYAEKNKINHERQANAY